MRKIDWNMFTGLCGANSYYRKKFKDRPLPQPFEGYIRGGMMTQEDAGRWSRPAEHQPSPEARDAMVVLMEIKLMQEDVSHHYESMEGDYCGWAINVASRLEHGEPLTPGDLWMIATDADWHLSQREEELTELEGEELERHMDAVLAITSRVRELMPELSQYKDHQDNIFNTVLC